MKNSKHLIRVINKLITSPKLYSAKVHQLNFKYYTNDNLFSNYILKIEKKIIGPSIYITHSTIKQPINKIVCNYDPYGENVFIYLY